MTRLLQQDAPVGSCGLVDHFRPAIISFVNVLLFIKPADGLPVGFFHRVQFILSVERLFNYFFWSNCLVCWLMLVLLSSPDTGQGLRCPSICYWVWIAMRSQHSDLLSMAQLNSQTLSVGAVKIILKLNSQLLRMNDWSWFYTVFTYDYRASNSFRLWHLIDPLAMGSPASRYSRAAKTNPPTAELFRWLTYQFFLANQRSLNIRAKFPFGLANTIAL